MMECPPLSIEQRVRMECVSILLMREGSGAWRTDDLIEFADRLTKFVLDGPDEPEPPALAVVSSREEAAA